MIWWTRWLRWLSCYLKIMMTWWQGALQTIDRLKNFYWRLPKGTNWNCFSPHFVISWLHPVMVSMNSDLEVCQHHLYHQILLSVDHRTAKMIRNWWGKFRKKVAKVWAKNIGSNLALWRGQLLCPIIRGLQKLPCHGKIPVNFYEKLQSKLNCLQQLTSNCLHTYGQWFLKHF